MVWRDENGKPFDAVSYFTNFELGEMPKPATDDMLDAGSLMWEQEEKVGPVAFPPAGFQDYGAEDGLDDSSFMSIGVL